MLEDIINSKTDSAILSFFLAAPPRAFSLVEISKRLKLPYLTAGRGMGHLATAGLLKSFAKRGKKYYMLNGYSKLLPALRGQWQKSGPKYQDELIFAIKRLGEIQAAFLSGLFSGQPALPVDILLVGRVNLHRLAEFLAGAERLMGQEINYSVMSVREFMLRRDTFDRFIKDIFDYPHVVVVDKLAKSAK